MMKEQKKAHLDRSQSQPVWKSRQLLTGQQAMSPLPDNYLVFVIKGNLRINMNNEAKSYTIHPSEMFIIQKDIPYIIQVLKPSHIISCRFQTEIFFSEQSLIDELIPWGRTNHDSFIKLPVNTTMKDFLTLLQDYLKDDLPSGLLFEKKREELFYLLFHYYSRLELARFLYFLAYEDIRFKEFIKSHYAHVKNIQELAALSNYSTSGFIKKFQRCFNESPYGWMQKQKAKQIAGEIRQGGKSFQEIANEYKFSSYQHFSRFCKKQLGAPPSDLLKSMKNEARKG
jgi:AraC-like DNA-binding protein